MINAPLDEDFGVCPKCKSEETVSSKAALRRVCLKCGYGEDFQSIEEVLTGWRPVKARVDHHKPKDVEKLIERVDGRITKIVVPTVYREDFSQCLVRRKISLAKPYKTDVWNNVESAYTEFELSVGYEVAEKIFDEWVASSDES